MIVWDWLSEINLMNTACILSDESNNRFSDSDYTKHLPQKLLKPFLIDIIETLYIDVFIIPIITKFQIAAGVVLSQLRKKYPFIKIIVIRFSDFNTSFSGDYLHIGWRLQGTALRYVDTATDSDESCDLLKREILEYIYSLDTVLVTQELNSGNFNNYWRLQKPQEYPSQTNNNENFQQFLKKECVMDIDSNPLENDDTSNENSHTRRLQIKRIKHKMDSTTQKVQELSEQLTKENALLNDYKTELQRLEGGIENTPESQEAQTIIKSTDDNPQYEHTNKVVRDIHIGLHDKFVLWPLGYCRYHCCGLDDIDMSKRKCVLRRGRAGICRHFDFVDEKGNIIEISNELYGRRRKSHKASYDANAETPKYKSKCGQGE